ncbi:restriction endonuclease subunit S [Vibrio parahaemolyticus]|uniref:restriction endonuclease subunit S n=1 Tax=Vibrio parahaemolyticus TaxID=670 RepID=UPI00084AD2D8|nr:restriction endonuclease subunit S [Vibrio parahaemolyticus]ODW89392.1 restriction endonuclease subunit S [Vibrio parahaemolyticus]ODX07835.1 restriction endonuclease subunit S [Vibrio parahaemolyticus]ODX08161.1 restriction endonuclease subunit S [Vibrio parahaemolyticus]ODX08964.1 restriction endonuclease subunit S [Vibrio parahaemolyticus]ODX23773.1 restriction endonuclease subunit S [Vibrio parahaemolyticus]
MAVENLITEHIDIWTSAVKAKSTSGRGSSKKLELYGVKKLRELILELAVRGKLVPQDPNDEPASVLLERIAAEKAKLVKAKKIKKQKSLGQVSKDEELFDTPTGWAWTRISEIAEISPRNSTTDDDAEVSFVPMPLITTNYDGSHGSEKRIWKEIKKGYTHFQDGDIALAKITPCFENSKAAVFSGLEGGVGAGTTELHVARPLSDCINPLFVLLYLKAPIFLKVGETKMTGSAGQKRVPKDFFSENPLPFPPSNEQHRIVAKVDELMTLCDQLEQQTEASIEAHQVLLTTLLDTLTNSVDADELMQNWARISEHFDTLFTTEESIDQLKQTILQLAVMGKLVPQDPSDEPASELLKRVAEEKAQLVKEKKIKKQKALPPISEDEKPFELPNGWEWCRIQDVALFTTSGSRDWAKYYSDSGALFVTMGNLSRGSYELRLDNLRFVRPPKGGEGSRTKLEARDLLISITGDVGNLGLIPEEFGEAYINQHTCLLRFMPECQGKYFPDFMRSPLAKYQFDAPQRGIKNSFRLSDVGEMHLPLPPLNEQVRITEKVSDLLSICERLKARLRESQITQLHLTDTIVEQAV